MIHNDRYFGLSHRIATWKHISDEEIALAEKAETDLNARKEYAEFYRSLDPEYYEKGKGFARNLIENIVDPPVDITFDDIYIDMVYCLHRYGLDFNDYSTFRLFNVSEHGRKQFVSDKLRYHYYDILNSAELGSIMTDKLKCYNHYKKYYDREVVGLLPECDPKEFINFLAKNESFIYKPLSSHSGRGVKKYSRNEIDNPRQWYDFMSQNHPGVVEELIVQSNKLNSLNPSSINTCRVVTFNTGHSIEIFAVTIRMGVNGALTDNAGAGGIYACVDPDSGIIISDARNYKGNHYIFHPTTNTAIPGFALPEWNKAKELVISAAKESPQSTLISWDIASYNKLGGVNWCIVEVNKCGACRIIQSNRAIGLKNKLYELIDRRRTIVGDANLTV